ncbi:MAG: OmpA family protein [Gammaproteobacteria bacterium]|nr:OmpA family protein [Gammaproteobacteria bacterium]
MRFYLHILLAAVTLAASIFAHAGLENMRGPLFAAADEARERCESANAKLLAPLSYGEAIEYYDRAESTFNRGGTIDSIRGSLKKSLGLFEKAADVSEAASVALDSTIQARLDAKSSDAIRYAPDNWDTGELAFGKATERLERGKMKYAQDYAEKAELAYRAAELEAIKANYLNETKTFLEQAKKLRADRYAPISITRARDLLATAEAELNSNRYDTDRPRSVALGAKHNALHAIYVAKLERSMRDGDTTLEQILLDWEGSIGKLGDAVDKPVYFDDGEKDAVQEVLASITELQRENTHLQQDLDDNTAQLATLNEQVETMKTRLGGENQTIEELNQLLAKQERHRQRFAKVETMFGADQANVLRKGDNVIIRMIGLNFDSGAAALKPEHASMLRVLENAIGVFPESRVMVEGHTDAFGSDDQNLELSQDRAEAVVQHLLSSMPISPTNLGSLGYGESRPVANNETPEGRTRNRRIDVVIEPSW